MKTTRNQASSFILVWDFGRGANNQQQNPLEGRGGEERSFRGREDTGKRKITKPNNHRVGVQNEARTALMERNHQKKRVARRGKKKMVRKGERRFGRIGRKISHIHVVGKKETTNPSGAES